MATSANSSANILQILSTIIYVANATTSSFARKSLPKILGRAFSGDFYLQATNLLLGHIIIIMKYTPVNIYGGLYHLP